MALSVAAALQLEVFSRTTVQVHAGEDQLHRTVRWVHPVEIPDIGQFLTGGELLLTAGLGVGRSAGDQRRYLREVSESGAAALILELGGRVFTSMPPALIDEAKQLDFPLIGLADELPFVEVSAQVHELVTDERNSDLLSFQRLNDDFIQLLLASRSHVSFTEALAHHVGSPVVLEDTDHQVMAYAGGTAGTDRLMKNWGLHARMAHRGDTPGGHSRSHMVQSHDEPGCTRRMVVLRGEAWGWIHVFHGDGPLVDVHAYALDRAADTIAIALLGDRESGARASHRQSSLINRLLLGDLTGEQFVDRALKVGRDLRDRPLAVAVLSKDPGAEGSAGLLLDSVLKDLKLPAVVADTGDHVVAITGLTKQLSVQQFAARLDTCGARGGVSRSGPPALLTDAVRQARTAASVAETRSSPATLHFDRLGVLRLLVALADGPELRRYVDDELGPLLTHDGSETNPLLPTLKAYLAADGNKSRAAEALYIQRRTLYYRIERLNGLLGRSVDDPEVRAGLSLALRALDLLGTSSRMPASPYPGANP
ncbi:PucR family transcriptional regulator [Streptomyces sp. NPDC059398]|uniref:PucR family transcriptional regulator n=1 Tax=Streptomyces sp. NPDC059398 TaxID=3346820 RepID=UPI0036CB9EF7